MKKQTLVFYPLVPVSAATLVLCYVAVDRGLITPGGEWHSLAEFGSGSLTLLILTFCAMYYRAGGEAPAVVAGLSCLSPTLAAVFFMTILPAILLVGDIKDLGMFAGSTAALAFAMLMTVGSAFVQRPVKDDRGSMIGLMVGVTLLSGAGAAGIMDFLASTRNGPGHLFYPDASMMTSIVAGTGAAAASFFCWRAGGRFNCRISSSLAIAATGHLASIVSADNFAFVVFSHVARILAQMRLFRSMLEETGDLMEEQKELSNQYRMYKWALDSVPMGVVSMSHAGRFETFNGEMQDIFGVSEREIAGRSPSEVAHLMGHRVSYEDWLSSLAAEGEREFQIRSRDGSTVTLASRTFPVNPVDGMAGGSVSIMRDVTEERRLEADLRASERLAIAGGMAGIVSSRLAAPIDRMKQEISFSLDCAQGEASGFLSLALHEVERLESLMRDLHFLQAPRGLNLRLISLGEVAQRVLELNRDGISRKAATTTITLSPRDGIMGDKYRIQQVVTNVVKNAVEAVRQGGVVSVQTRVDNGRGVVALEVRNTGDRIPEPDLARVFEPFFSTKSSGTGLGLSVCKRIIEDHGGEICIRNERDGVVCAIELPACFPTVTVIH